MARKNKRSSRRKPKDDLGLLPSLMVIFLAGYLLVLLPCVGLYQQWRQYDAELTVESIERGTDDRGHSVTFLKGHGATKAEGIPLRAVRWEGSPATAPSVGAVLKLRVQDTGPANLMSRFKLWGGERTYRALRPDEGLWGRAFSSNDTGMAALAVLYLCHHLVKAVFRGVTFRPVAPKDGVYRFDKPLWAELTVILLGVTVVIAGVGSSYLLWQSDDAFTMCAVDTVIVLFMVGKYGVMALLEARNWRDFIEVGPERIRVQDSGGVTVDLARDEVASVRVLEDKESDATRLVLKLKAGEQHSFALEDMNLEGFADQLAALFATDSDRATTNVGLSPDEAASG